MEKIGEGEVANGDSEKVTPMLVIWGFIYRVMGMRDLIFRIA